MQVKLLCGKYFVDAEFAGCPYTGPFISTLKSILDSYIKCSDTRKIPSGSLGVPVLHSAVSSCGASFCCITADKSIPWPIPLTPVPLVPGASLAHGEALSVLLMVQEDLPAKDRMYQW